MTLDAAAQKAAEFWSTGPAELAGARNAVRGAMILPEKPGAIRTHLELRWKASKESPDTAAALAVYRTAGGYVLVRF